MSQKSQQVQQLRYNIAKVQAGVLALVMALFGGLGLFIITAWLLIKGGKNVGAHLNLLGEFFVGYNVSWPGSFIGIFYGAATGAVIGWLIGFIYNFIVNLRRS